jgi:hypothetical protein
MMASFEFRIRVDGATCETDSTDWCAVQYREMPLETWSTVPRRFSSLEKAEDYIAEMERDD